MHYNADEDYHVCPMGQHLEHIGDVKSTSDLGYKSTVSRYRAQVNVEFGLVALAHNLRKYIALGGAERSKAVSSCL